MIKELRSRTLTGIVPFKSNTYKNTNSKKYWGITRTRTGDNTG